MRTRVPVTGTRVWCHQAESRDHSLVSRARNQHFNSNCHRFKSVNYLAIHCNRGKTKVKRSSVFILNLYSLILGMILSVKWLNDRRALLSDCWYWNIFVRSLRHCVTWQSCPRVSPPAPEYGTSPRHMKLPRPPAPARPRLAPRPTAPWSRCQQRSAVFTFLRPSPGGKLARIITVYKITV